MKIMNGDGLIMKKKFRIIALSLTAIMLTALMSACGGKEDIPTITWYMPKSIDNMSSQSMVEDELNKIFEKEVGARLKLNLIDEASYAEKMNVVINSGEEFDIMFSGGYMPSTSFETNAPKGTFMDLTELLDKYGQDIKKKVDPRAWETITYDGKIQIIPSQSKLGWDVGYTFKKDLVDKYNFDYKSVKTMKDLEPYFEILKENEPDIVPVLDIETPNWGFSDINSLGGGWLVLFDEEKEEFFYRMDDNRELESYRLRNEWYQKGYFPKDAITLNAAEAKKTGKYAVMTHAGAITEDGAKSSAAYGFPCVDQKVDSFSCTGAFNFGQAISATSKHPEEAMKILNLIWKDPYISNTLAYGIEGVDYVYESGKGTDNPTVIPKDGADKTWTIWHNFVGPLFDQWNSSWNSTEALQKMQEDNKTVIISKKADVIFDTEPIKAELAALNEIWQSADKVLQYGAMTDFDSYISELKQKCDTAGMEKVITELNRQYKEAKGK